MRHEQVITVKVSYEDESCDPEHEADCCGPGQCENRCATPEEWNYASTDYAADSIEVIASSPARDVYTGE